MNAPHHPSELARESLPWSAEAEYSVIGSVFIDNRAFDRASLDAADFFDGRNRLIWAAVQTLAAARKPIDAVTIFETLQGRGQADDAGGLAHLNDLTTCVPNARHIARYAEIVKDRAALRELRARLIEAGETASGEGDTPAKVAQIVGSLAELQRVSVKSSPRHVAELALMRTDHYDRLSRGEVLPGLRTHIPVLDSMLGGGLKDGALYILAARPSVGKSSLSQQITLNVAKDNNPALFLSQEMPSEELTDRAVSNIGRIDYGALQVGNLSRDEWQRVTECLSDLARLPVHLDDQSQLTVSDIRIKAQMVPGLKLLVIDYLQLCASTRKDGNRNLELEEVSRGLKSLAKELCIPVIALAQLNRDVERRADREPILSDLRDCGAIEQDADCVMFLWPISEQLVGLKVAKQRGGRKGRFGLHFEGCFQRWSESTANIDFKPEESRKRFSKGFDDER